MIRTCLRVLNLPKSQQSIYTGEQSHRGPMASSQKPVPRIISASVFSFLDSCFLYSFIKPILKTPPTLLKTRNKMEKMNKCFLVRMHSGLKSDAFILFRRFKTCGKKSPLLPGPTEVLGIPKRGATCTNDILPVPFRDDSM